MTDYEILYYVVNDRWEKLYVYSPLSKRLSKLLEKLVDNKELTK